jgi:hypothetical protein
VQAAPRADWGLEQLGALLGMREAGWGPGGSRKWEGKQAGPCADFNSQQLSSKWMRLKALAAKATPATLVPAGSGSNKRLGLEPPPGFWQRMQAQAARERGSA